MSEQHLHAIDLRRRRLLGAAAVATGLWMCPLRGPRAELLVHTTGEIVPPIGLGSWITFNVGDDAELRDDCAAVIGEFFALGGRLIDSSPMYGSSQAVIGHALRKLDRQRDLFAADKVWTGDRDGRTQIEQSRRHWSVPRFDLLQVHNLLGVEHHLATLREMKQSGQLRYVGITTSEGRRHDEIERLLKNEPLDFVQFTYNILDREVEQRLLPLATERGVRVICNRPFRQGILIDALRNKPLPPWAGEIDCTNWAQFLLKFIISHPAVTCAIPATSQVAHVRENMGAAHGRMPDAAMRQRMIAYVEAL
ncbi:aldo/keto reductase [Tahibacter amnicola]|uniref:Aldo/keto reductase n=1 Tax=Tahibacter amnicola TaxID=2976241 RepID=A0ABY6BNJ4_9GAMM|nr:aldo/keto reductase [Tahibacter amnicola]UXI70136.1 aldo/keto reductase [Tahibacter amnicola]